MNIENKTIWQQACGDTNRNHSNICLKWDAILSGPGYAGEYPDCIKRLKNIGWKSRKLTDIKRFANKIKDGDIVVLRLGTNTILGVGQIVGEYEWHECFGDVDGWDLQHVRRVKWLWNGIDNPKKFKTYALKLGDTTQLMTSEIVKDWLRQLDIPEEKHNKMPVELPKAGHSTDQNEIAQYLFEQGISSNSIENLTKVFDELKRIAKWYLRTTTPSEFETVSYLVVPILRALGWTPQKMAIEWHNVDLALFDQLPRIDKNLSVVVEVKKKGNACLTAKSQAQGYAQGKPNCKRLIVTDGLRYGTYIKNNNEYALKAYFNLNDLRVSYPIYECSGIKEALRIMTPEWINE